MTDTYILEVLQNAPALKAWGKFVASEVLQSVIAVDGRLEEDLLKVPVKIRLKKEGSIRAKIAKYELLNPKDEIKDLVGVRFVVLLKSELSLFEAAIEAGSSWNFEKVKDFGAYTAANPELFDYQSIHYILTSLRDFRVKDVDIKQGTSCEVQIRTLLQHAYAELTHDNIYKPIQIVPHQAKRYVARSMALMETTDDLFNQTLSALRIANEPRNNVLKILLDNFSDLLGWSNSPRIDGRINLEIIETYIDQISVDTFEQDIKKFFEDNAWIQEPILEHAAERFLFSQPVVLLLFWLIQTREDFIVKSRWTLMSMLEDLRLIFNLTGNAFGDQL
jgi:ppGpp synthetase/RelA/SpoT-type nucleotidyltranferase